MSVGWSPDRYLLLCFILAVCCVHSLPVPPKELQRFGHSSITLYDGQIAIFGGYDFQSKDASTLLFSGLKNDIWLFNFVEGGSLNDTVNPNLTTGLWRLEYPSIASARPAPRMMHVASHAYRNGHDLMTISGGLIRASYTGSSSTIYKGCGVDDVWMYNFTSSLWKEMKPITQVQCNSGARQGAWVVLLVALLLLSFN
eukprot:TRINITY_DN4921_c0_g1_i1.p1 TRINITY_DN4921_c0_g1~~TRINITY_DN4921_c0_g1_i1.p1  ORF type:complete len:198 (-),score=18.41 TRINITY_DN4921_c0_g1_i1:34-627(-)